MHCRNLAPATVLGLLLAVTGCGYLEQRAEYEHVAEGQRLEVPPDLDAPDERRALRVPNATDSQVQGGAVSDRPGSPDSVDASDPSDAGDARERTALVVDDDVESVFRRLGFALERIGVEIVERDAQAGYYVVDYVDTRAREQRPNVISRWVLRRQGPEDFSGNYRLEVRDDAAGTMVILLDDRGQAAPDRVAAELLGAIDARLG